MSTRKILALTSLIVLTAVIAMGCEALTVKTMGVAILTKTPALDNNNLDQRLLDAVGELPFDEVALATAFVAERPSLTDTTAAPEGISGAAVRMSFVGKTVDLNEVTAAPEARGTYMAVSADLDDTVTDDDLFVQTNLEYIAGTEYVVYIDILGDYYDLTITAPAAIPAANVTFNGGDLTAATYTIPTQNDLVIDTHPRNTDLTVAWTSANPDEPQNAFVTLAHIEYTGAADMSQVLEATAWQAPTGDPYTNFPTTPEQFLTLVTEPPAESHTIPAAQFANPGLYVLLVTAAELNTDNTMSVGSAGIGGVATPFVFLVEP